ncbi:hypothetical protein THASP1DRAFT_26063 [Thamnocephalis sphaerospora]|uniref:DUF7137 domain-containing protein n=1 Tax=Thamnocephalis sphaerospora TaxID=78915 RepID=A0A4P9XIC9_9FUNG|nr:hypothetical protein THASP1DRAFT_26063 [Thamnocephalis sphaerospora]|eukprot:RKP05442.1 hypothetical protein THASP1DRAFT_26063 [Thamnocephalis sphaerospora]
MKAHPLSSWFLLAALIVALAVLCERVHPARADQLVIYRRDKNGDKKNQDEKTSDDKKNQGEKTSDDKKSQGEKTSNDKKSNDGKNAKDKNANNAKHGTNTTRQDDDDSNGQDGEKSSDGSSKPDGSNNKNSTYPGRLIITDPILFESVVPRFVIGSSIVFKWKYDEYLRFPPENLTIEATGPGRRIYTLAANISGETTEFKWDTLDWDDTKDGPLQEYAHYQLVIYDERGRDAPPESGKLLTYRGTAFALTNGGVMTMCLACLSAGTRRWAIERSSGPLAWLGHVEMTVFGLLLAGVGLLA